MTVLQRELKIHKLSILRNLWYVSSTNCINSHSHWGVEMWPSQLLYYSPQDEIKMKYDTVVAENNQLLKNIERMSELSLQVVAARNTIMDLEKRLALDQVQVLT